MKHLTSWIFAATMALFVSSCGEKSKFAYETVEGDPMNTQIYTLKNGLKVFMTVNKEQPRIQTYIAVHAGGKDDPAESTGLAHYLEHLMFKGTRQFGTWNYEQEAVELAKIDSLYEVYNHTTDEAQRKAIYHEIDSVSYEASRYAIPNEYDKLMAAIGASGTNAYTSQDVTCYTEEIPSNQIENWAKIQSDRFQNMVIRLFHTELEAVYEEKNIGMASDMRKVLENMDAMLYPHHPYGTQTVIGTQDHLKNPSIVNIRKYFENYYRPNNVAICLSGDFNPDDMVAVIEKYFGEWQPNENIQRKPLQKAEPITQPIVRDVLGEEAENVWIGWRTPAEKEEDNLALDIATTMLQNGSAGLLDLNLVQTHKVLQAGCFNYTREQGSEVMLYAYPMPGQTLDEARQLLLDEVEKLKNGQFDERLLASVLTDYKLAREKALEENESRADQFVQAFVAGQTWAERVAADQKKMNVTKEDIMRVAKQYLGQENYACINKLQGVDPDIKQIDKPEINPVMTNRDSVSHFLREIQDNEVAPIAPVFLDFKKDLSFGQADKDIEVIHKANDLNGLFKMQYIYEYGMNADRLIDVAMDYLDYVGTDGMTVDQVKQEFYSLGCTFSWNVGSKRTTITLSGLDENKEKAIQLMEKLLNAPTPDAEALNNLKAAILQAREVNMSSQDFCRQALNLYCLYGMDKVKMQNLTNAEIMALEADKLVAEIQQLQQYKPTITYYGPDTMEDVIAIVNAEHKTPAQFLPTPEIPNFYLLPTRQNKVFLCHYPAPNAQIYALTNLENTFNPDIEAARIMYNEYFGGGMNTVVFQEIRESRGLAYSCSSYLVGTSFKDDPYSDFYYAATQVDKLGDCMSAFQEIVENMPQSEAAFNIAKQSLITRLRTSRTTRDAVISAYIDAKDQGLDYDLTKTIFEAVENMTLKDVLALQQKYVKGRPHYYSIVADRTRVDMNVVKSLGEVTEVNIKDICGYY